ncbi:MAG TPA: hypothetical protein VFU21_24930, partial [Kofleriaceae bacterium]|nr:hypothetical protein [Kofleriaceae bacterium]
WVRVKPRMSAWTASPAGGAPGVLLRATPYWWKGPAGVSAAMVGEDQVEEIADLEVAGRRWIASQVASDLRGKPLPATPPAIAAALGVRQPLSRDGEIAITALMLESAMEPDDRPPGFRGPDAWFRSTGRPDELTVTADEAIARGLPPVDIRLDASGSGLIHSPLSRRGAFYLRLHGPPADPYEFAIWPALDDEGRASGIERSMRRVYEIRRPEDLRFGGHLRPVQVAGADRPAVCVYAALPPPMPGIVTCVVLIEHARGVVMAAFTHDVARDQELTPAQVLEHPRLRGIARSLQVS